jgi:hypothetical protein
VRPREVMGKFAVINCGKSYTECKYNISGSSNYNTKGSSIITTIQREVV